VVYGSGFLHQAGSFQGKAEVGVTDYYEGGGHENEYKPNRDIQKRKIDFLEVAN
jgi:hypothetical protein